MMTLLLGLLVLRPSISSLLQSATAFLLQSATGITKCDNFITKCDRYYKVRRLLQSATVQRLLVFTLIWLFWPCQNN